MRITAIVLAAVVTCLAAARLEAQFVWSGSAGNGNPLTGTNWVGNTAPGGISGAEALTFGDVPTTPQSITISIATLAVNDVVFNGPARPVYTFGGVGASPPILVLTGNLTETGSTTPVTFNSSLHLTLDSSLAADHTVDILADGVVVVYSPIAGTGSNLIKAGAGTLTLGGANTYSGTTTVRNGTLAVDAGSISHSLSTLTVGSVSGDNATLAISNGGDVTNALGVIGSASGSTGTVTVAGTGSTWTNSSDHLIVGSSGSGTLTISSGGTVFNPYATIGDNIGGVGTVTVDGTGSAMTNANEFVVGSAGTGTLNIINGGSVSAFYSNLGSLAGGNGTATVDGSGSMWSTAHDLRIGYFGTGSLTISAGGSVTAGDSVLIGTFTGSSATATVTGAGSTLSSILGLFIGYNGGNGTLTLSSGGQATVNNGAGAVTIGSAGTSTGTVNIGASAVVPAAAGGILNAASLTTGAGSTGTLQFNTTGTSASPYYFTKTGLAGGTAIAIAGATQVVNTGGFNVLSGSNTYTGQTAINGGTLAVDTLADGGVASTLGMSTGAAANLILNGTLQYAGLGSTTNRLFTLGALGGIIDASGAGTVSFTNTGNIAFLSSGTPRTLTLAGTAIGNIFAPVIGDAGAGATSLNKTGTGKWTLTGANTYTGGTTISAGTLQIGGGGTTGSIVGNIVNNAGLVFLRSNSLSYAGNISGTGALLKSAAGTLILTGANTYTGSTTINGGTLSVSSLGNGGVASGIGAASSAAANIVIDGGQLTYSGSAATSDRLFTLGTGGGTISINNLNLTNTGGIGLLGTNTARTLTLTGTGSFNPLLGDNGAGKTSLTQSGNGMLSLGGLNTYTGATTISGLTTIGGATVTALADGGIASNIGASSNAAANLVINASLRYVGGATSTDRLMTFGNGGGTSTPSVYLDASGTGPLVFTNPGPIVLTGTNSARIIGLAGTSTALNTLTPILGDNGTGATSVQKMGAGNWVLAGANTYTGTTTISGGALYADSLANGGLASSIGASSNTASNLLLQGGTFGYLGTAAGTTDRLLTLDASSGGIEASGSGPLTFTNNGTVAYTGTNAPHTLTFSGASTAANTFNPMITDNGTGTTSVVKSGSGTWSLGSANSYSGNTTITGGTLIALHPNAFGSGTLVLNGGSVSGGGEVLIPNPITFAGSGGILTGDFTGFSSHVSVGVGGVIAPGNSTGALYFTGGLTLGSGATIDFEIQDATGPAGTGYDLIVTSGLIDGANSSLAISLISSANPVTFNVSTLNSDGYPGGMMSFNPANSYSWTFATAANGISGFAPEQFALNLSGFANATAGGSFSFGSTADSLTLNFTPVPEPSTWVLLATGAAALGVAALRKRKH